MERKYISVFTLNKYIKAKMNQDVSLQNVYIKGEISNYRPHPSGHLYFTLKDENSRVSVIMFESNAKKLDFQIENGMQVLMRAKVDVYEPNGQYQLYAQDMQEDGIGKLYFQYEKLKKSLEQEGLFQSKYKKQISKFPRSIAVLAAKQSAAVQDIVRTIYMRFPVVRVIVFPIPVQGKNAYLQIINTLKQVDNIGFDTIILARGGGSIEELWNFNEEALARCIFDLKTPIISGVGHETDFTICDFVSDYRSITPTAAAIDATPDQKELLKYQAIRYQKLISQMDHYLKNKQNYLAQIKNSYYLKNPEYIYSNEFLRLSHLQDRLSYQFKMFHMKETQKSTAIRGKLLELMKYHMLSFERNNQLLFSKLDALSPLKIMQRGYTFIKKDDHIVKNGKDLKSGDCIEIVFYDEKKKAEVK